MKSEEAVALYGKRAQRLREKRGEVERVLSTLATPRPNPTADAEVALRKLAAASGFRGLRQRQFGNLPIGMDAGHLDPNAELVEACQGQMKALAAAADYLDFIAAHIPPGETFRIPVGGGGSGGYLMSRQMPDLLGGGDENEIGLPG